MKKYVNNSFINKSPLEYKNGTKAVTSLPVEIFTDGQPVSSYTLKGNTSVSGTPSPSNPVTIQGVGEETANLFDYKTMALGLQNTYLDSSGNELSSNDWNVTTYIPCDGTTFTLYPIGGNTPAICLYDDNKQFIVGKSYNTGGAGSKKAVTITSNTTAKYIRFTYCISTINPESKDDITALYLLEGSYTSSTIPPFEPYGFKISISSNGTALTPVYLGDVQTTRQIVKRELTGEEQWASAGAGASIYYQLNIGALNSVITGVSLSSHFQNAQISTSTTDVGVRVYNSSSSNLAALNIRPENVSTDYNTAAKFKQWLADQNTAGTPVIVYYVRTTAITSTVNEPLMKIDEYADSIDSTQSGVTIPTTGGEVSIDVDTTVKPSELDLTYHGWHTHEPLKRENGAWT